jgi:hypothetical protein
MKLDKDQFPANINMVEIDGKKVLVRPSRAESTKGKEVCQRRGETTEDDQAQKFRNWPMEEERQKKATISSKSHLRHPHI